VPVSDDKLYEIRGVNAADTEFLSWLKSASPEVFDVLKSNEAGGGGFSLAGEKRGKTSSVTGDISWKLCCKSRHSYGCPAAANVVYRKASGMLHLEIATVECHTLEITL
jgi:hypothetical protein